MTGLELKLIFDRDKAYLAIGIALRLDQLDLPKVTKAFQLSYWTIRVLNYDKVKQEIFCEVIFYGMGPVDFDEEQRRLSRQLGEIKSIRFRSIDTLAMFRALNRTNRENVPLIRSRTVYRTVDTPRADLVNISTKRFIRETFSVAIKDVRFVQSGVLVEKKFYQYYKPLELKIINEDIKEEYDAIKNYFANVLKTKKIQVSVNIEITDEELNSRDVKSPEIAMINQELIENVKIELIKFGIQKSDPGTEKIVFTVDEFFEGLTDGNSDSGLFYNNEKAFLEDLISISNSKHYHHLRFLSSRHAHDVIKLRFIQKPLSFIFLILGEHQNHFVWETLDTEEATYIWSIDKDIEAIKPTLKYLDDSIRMIKESGKTAYIKSAKHHFKRLQHDYSNVKSGFTKWKNRMNILVQ